MLESEICVIARGKQLKDYVGKNDKTKIVIKLAIIGAGKKEKTVFCIKTFPICNPRTTSEGAWHE